MRYLALCLVTTAVIAQPSAAYGVPLSLTLSPVTVVEGTKACSVLRRVGGNGSSPTVAWTTKDGTAKAGANYAAAGNRLRLPSGGLTLCAQTFDDKAANTARTFMFKASVVSGTARPAISATVTISDNDTADNTTPPPDPSPPAPNPTPTPAPPPSGDVLNPPGGIANIASSFSADAALGTVDIPGSSAPDVGAFRFECGPGQVLRDDPMVYPGQPGKSHLHQFFGNTLANANSTYTSLRTTGKSTCGDQRSTTPVNRSGYWVPALLDGKGNMIAVDQVGIYYKRWPANTFHCNTRGDYPNGFDVLAQACVPLPNGLRYIFGYNMLNPTQSPTGAVEFKCNSDLANYETLTQALARCKKFGGKQLLIATINAPECWDGLRLDSADHRAHVSYASYGNGPDGYGGWGYLRCDAAHPYAIPKFTMNVNYTIDFNVDDPNLIHYSSDEAMGTAPGVTFHGDWWGAWDPIVQGYWQDNCINRQLNCSGGNLGNGKTMVGADAARYYDGSGNLVSVNVNPQRLQPIPAP